jgi:thiosulfate/3-mercaptopyruvate sulfurtransferase
MLCQLRRTKPLISAHELAEALDGPARPTLLDVRWELGGPPGSGREAYLSGHIPGAVFVDLESDLSGPPGRGGRHPLPDARSFERAMRAAGVSGARPVVVYDSMAAARAWWTLRYFGHPAVAVLDGGLAGWEGPLERGEPAAPAPGDFSAKPGGMPTLDAAAAAELANSGVLLDARAPERYRGDVEPIDPVAGHIPGALNAPASENVTPDGRFKPPHNLRDQFERAGVRDHAPLGAYCGSGVSAATDVLALELAGFPGAALYVGSWSEWCRDAGRPVARSRRDSREPG